MKTYYNEGSSAFTRPLEIRNLIFIVGSTWILGNKIMLYLCILCYYIKTFIKMLIWNILKNVGNFFDDVTIISNWTCQLMWPWSQTEH